MVVNPSKVKNPSQVTLDGHISKEVWAFPTGSVDLARSFFAISQVFIKPSKSMKKYIVSVFVILSLVSFNTVRAAALTQGQVNAIISILQAFGVDSVTVANVKNDLTINITIPNVTTASIIPTVTYKTWVPVNLQTLPATTTQSQPIQQIVQPTVLISIPTPITTSLENIPVSVILPTATTPVIPALTISQGNATYPLGSPLIGESVLTAGPDEVEIDTVTITVTGDPTQVKNVMVRANNQNMEMGDGYSYESSIKLYPTTQWYVPGTQNEILAGGTLTIDIIAQGTASAQVTGFSGKDLVTGKAITQ